MARSFSTWSIVRFCASVFVLLATLGIGAAPSQAAPRPDLGIITDLDLDLQTITASDGVVPPVVELAAQERAGADLFSAGSMGSAPAADLLQPDSIIGADTRYRIYGTTSYPNRAVVFIRRNGAHHCTGWLIGPDTVATAGHCVFDNGAWTAGLTVAPGFNEATAPYGTCSARRLYSVLGWTRDRHVDYDYGAIKLNCTVGNTVGWLGFRWTSASLAGTFAYITGYPGDKVPPTMWESNGYISYDTDRKLFYQHDTTGGMSGSPVWNYHAACNGPCGMAIHTNGVFGGVNYNRATRINAEVFNNLVAWKNAA